LTIIATSHNRCPMTVAALLRAQASARAAGVEPRLILVDANSSDGTARAVKAALGDVDVVTVGADHFWAMGMRVAMAAAVEQSPDFVLWVNDDTLLFDSAVRTLLETAESLPDGGIVAGAVHDEATGERTYGGLVNTIPWGLRLRPVPVTAAAVPCDAVNGNVVLISRRVVDEIGILDDRFTHALGDWDFSLRARKKGLPVVQAPGFVATCSHNSQVGGWRDRSLPFGRRVRLMRAPKGLPPAEWVRFQLRHGRLEAPVNMVRPWVRLALDEVSRRRRLRAPSTSAHHRHGEQ
jgi:GT2 family glycosyltransferase